MVLVDSSVWIGYFNGADTWQVERLDQLLGRESIIMGDLILTEVLQGFRSDRDFRTAQRRLGELPFRTIGSYEVAVQSAVNYRLLRKKGVTVRKTIDVVIGTFCIIENLLLLHDDRDFEPLTTQLSLKTVSQVSLLPR